MAETKELKKKAPAKPRAPKATKKAAAEAPATAVEKPSGEYIFALGRRKSSVARVRLYKEGNGSIVVNEKSAESYFPGFELREMLVSVMKTVGMEGAMAVTASVDGGGVRGQAEAVRLGMARALCQLNPAYRTVLKKMGYLTRDPREKERKKPGLKKARRAPQWNKR